MSVATKELVIEEVLFDAMEIAEHGHTAPADAKCAVDMGLGPFKNARQFVPVSDLFKRQMFDRGACDNQTVKLLA